MLSGNYHNVHTGIAVHHSGRVVSGLASARVKFKPLSDDEIYAYIDGGEPMDKAGAYAVQGRASVYIKGLDGDYFNVVGLPVNLLAKTLKESYGIDLVV
jgi:septum formation protein